MTRVVRIHSDLRWSLTSIYGLKRENAKIHPFRCYTICTTRCGFVNVVFGFAARKASRHQLHKHVSAHVYLGVLAYYAKQRPSRCWGPHAHVDEPFCDVHVFVAYWSSHVAGAQACPGRRLTAHAHSRYTRYTLDTRYHDYMSWSPARRNSYRRLARKLPCGSGSTTTF